MIFVPPYSLYVFAAIIIFCTASIFLSVKICKINSTNIQTKSRNLIGTAVLVCIVSEVALVISTIIMALLPLVFMGPLTAVYNEFGGTSNVVIVSYYVIYGLIYANLQFPSAFILKKAIGNQFVGFFVCFVGFNTGIWVTGNIILGLLGIPY